MVPVYISRLLFLRRGEGSRLWDRGRGKSTLILLADRGGQRLGTVHPLQARR